MAVNETAADYRLPCGRDVDQVWEHLDEVDAEHERTCPHCGAVRESLVLLREATGQLAAEEIAPPAGLTGRIMAAVRADVRRRDLLPLPTSEPGRVRISDQAVAAVLRFAADTVPGVRARRCRVSHVDGTESDVRVEMSLAVHYPEFTASALDEVRERVTAAAAARIGLRLTELELVLEDLYLP
ncbi:Asp23/Gls24 family envelope stress response protein [Kutzneria sp. NPDC052558]|uniref:Asp23/Gls24 family envelope stress response protein n=1 Tax=Kutzneria sp. NPDC052558 TaxID=3364121 RepID=UPI0037CBF6C8